MKATRKTRQKTKKLSKSPRKNHRKSPRELLDETLRGLPAQESEEIVLAIRRGKIDALVVAGNEGDEVLTLQGADHPYRVLVETINDGVATLDADGVVLYANSRFAAILRIPAENFIGTCLQSHISPVDRKTLQDLIAAGLSNSIQGEITLDASEGRPRLVRLSLNPVKNSVPKTVCIVATELTELVEANEALRLNEESLRLLSARLLKLQDEERRHIARDLHDITGQKLAVQSMALSEVLNRLGANLDDESRRILLQCASLSKEIGEDIRTLSYLLHPPLLDELGLASAVGWYAEGFEQRTGIQVKVDIAGLVRLPQDVEVALFRVIQESLTNIHRYSGSPKALVRVKVGSDRIEAQIRDFGKGIHPDVLNSRTGKVAPLGVGIQGMKERIRQLAGKLEISSEPNKGTVITATLPLSHLQAAAATSESAGTSVLSSHERLSEVPVPERAAARKHILIADDHEMLRRGVRTMLEKETNWEICGEAVDGQDAVEKAAALRPDLVILDINMPVLNGLAAVRQILRHRPQTKILVFTVHDSDQTMKEIQAAGAHGYLSKSNASSDLLRVVKNLLDSKTTSTAAIA